MKNLVVKLAGSSVVALSRRLGNGRPLIGNFQSLDSGDRSETKWKQTFLLELPTSSAPC